MSGDLKALLAATEAVGDAITAGHWEEAASLEAARRNSLQAFIQTKLADGADPERLKSDIEALNAETRRLLGVADHQQRRLVREAFVARSGRNAVETYQRNSAKP